MDLTKKLTERYTDKRGKERIRCAGYGKPYCRDRRYKCSGCRLFEGILLELEALEDYYINCVEEDE